LRGTVIYKHLCCREGFRHLALKNANGGYVDTGKTYMSYTKMCVDGSRDPSEGVNRSMVDKTVPWRNETILPVVDGTVLCAEEERMLEELGWRVDSGATIFLQHLSGTQVKFQTEVRGRGLAPRNDRLPDSENDTHNFARLRAERERRGVERELEREMKEVESELTTRPRERPDVDSKRKFRTVGKVSQAMRKMLDQAEEIRTAVHIVEFKERELLKLRLLEKGSLLYGEREEAHTVTIDKAPRCDSMCEDYEKNLKEGSKGSWLHCRHVYAVLFIGLNVRSNTGGKDNVPLVHQATFTTLEVIQMLSKQLDVNRMGGEYEEWDA
jgi:hypothetical protein